MDPDNNSVRYEFDWGDNTTTKTPFHPSGETVTIFHNWSIDGTYLVKARAYDEYGAMSNWSQPLLFIVDTVKPRINFTSVTENMVIKGSANITVDVDDEHPARVLFELICKNQTIDSYNCSIVPYLWILNTEKYKEGEYILKATAYDIANNTAWSTIHISIKHPQETPGFEILLLLTAVILIALVIRYRRRLV